MIDSTLDVIALIAWAPFAAFFLLYTITRKWWRRLAGWSVWLLALTCTLALSGSVWRQLTETAPPNWYRWVSFLLIIAAGWFQLVSFLVVVAHGDRRPRYDRRQSAVIGHDDPIHAPFPDGG